MAEAIRGGRRKRRSRLPMFGSVSRVFSDLGLQQNQRWVGIFTALLIVAMMTMGGGVPGFLQIVLFGFLAIALLLAGALDKGAGCAIAPSPLFRIGLGLMVAVPALQLIPLPPFIWHALPGEEVRQAVLALAQADQRWQPISLTPMATANGAVLTVIFVALIEVLLALSVRALRAAAWLMLGILVAGLGIGLIQVASGGTLLKMHSIASDGALLGFFANKNHMGLALAVSLPLAAYLVESTQRNRTLRILQGVYGAIVLVALITTNSRAGLVLGIVSAALIYVRFIKMKKPAYTAALLVGVIVLAAFIGTSSAFENLFGRFGTASDDLRWEFLVHSQPLLREYWAWGSGIGSFATVYIASEHLAWVNPYFVNQLHDEYPQLLLEGGLFGVIVLIINMVGLLSFAWKNWWRSSAASRRIIAFGLLITALFAAHSFLDYPLRRPAMLPLLAFGVALIVRGSELAPHRVRQGRIT